LPHPLLLLLCVVGMAAILTWILPTGEYERRDDPATGRQVAVPGTYHAVEATPVGPMDAAVAIPRGFVEAAEVIATILFVGGAWVVLDRLGTLPRLVTSVVTALHGRGLIAIPLVALLFATFGALENMQEEIIALIPVLLLLGRGLGVDALTVAAMSIGAAGVGSAFGPTNPFQAGIALKIAQLPPLDAGGLRVGLLLAAVACWIGWTLRHAMRHRTEPSRDVTTGARASLRDLALLAVVVAPMVAYVVGALAWGWSLNELSAGFLVAGIAAGLLGGLGVNGTFNAYFEGMQALLPAAVLVGVARAITVVLADGHVIDTILYGLATPLEGLPGTLAAMTMVPVHAIVHVLVPSVSGHAVLTLPVMVPLADLLELPRMVAVLAYSVGAGLTDILTPTNGALMAVLLAAGVPYGQWLRFALGGALLCALVGIVGMIALM
jgi:uncharacterized ion transporter superfamily protein YfcC